MLSSRPAEPWADSGFVKRGAGAATGAVRWLYPYITRTGRPHSRNSKQPGTCKSPIQVRIPPPQLSAALPLPFCSQWYLPSPLCLPCHYSHCLYTLGGRMSCYWLTPLVLCREPGSAEDSSKGQVPPPCVCSWAVREWLRRSGGEEEPACCCYSRYNPAPRTAQLEQGSQRMRTGAVVCGGRGN